MPLVDSLRRLSSGTQRWSVSALLGFGPRLTDFAIPDGHTMTVLLEGFKEPPEVSLLVGETSIQPASCVSLSSEPGRRSWQAVFECPKPLPESNQDLRLVRSGSGKVVRAVVREPNPDRPTRDATWDGARWVLATAHSSRWRARREGTDTQLTQVVPGRGTLRLVTSAPGGSTPVALVVTGDRDSSPLYHLASEGDGCYRLDVGEFLQAVNCDNLAERSNWRIWATTESTDPRELRFASRDLVFPRDAIVYPTETVIVGHSSFVVRAYWSAIGTLRMSVHRAETPAERGASV